MKNPVLSVSTVIFALLIILASGISRGQSEFELYGRADITANQINLNSLLPPQQEWQLNSNASRVGFRGSYRISDSLEAIYQLELEVNFDDDDSIAARGKDLFENRNTYIGLQGNFGRIIAGRHDTPAKTAGREVDRFNDQVVADIKNFMEGEDRISDLLMYTTPDWMGFSATAGIITAEDSSGVTGNSGFAHGSTLSLNFSNNFVTAAITSNNDVDKQDLTRLMTNFYIGATEVGFIWQQAERIDIDADEESWFISAEHRINEDWRIKGQYGITKYSVLSNKDEQFALGLDRILNSNAFLYVNYVQLDRDKTVDSFSDNSLAIGFRISF